MAPSRRYHQFSRALVQLAPPAHFKDVDPTEVTFLNRLHKTRNSSIFLILLRGVLCVMKVYHIVPPPEWDEEKPSIYENEKRAYLRLEEYGVCEAGFVPKFFGFVDYFQPKNWLPYLSNFTDGELPPKAIFLEYIPNIQSLTVETVTKPRMERLTACVKAVHAAGVMHGDTRARNFMIDPTSKNRAFLLDFDRAYLYDITDYDSHIASFLWIEENLPMDLVEGAETQRNNPNDVSKICGWFYN